MDVFMPKLQIDSGGVFRGTYKSAIDGITLTGNVPYVVFSKLPFKGVEISTRTQNGALYFATTISRFEPADSMFFDNITVTSFTHNDSLMADIDFENKVDSTTNTGSISAVAHFFDINKITINLPKVNIDAFSYQWKADPDNAIVIEGNKITIDRLVIETPTESFRAFGTISPNPEDQLNIILTKFNLANVNRFVPDKVIQLAGNLNGSFSVSNLYDEPLFRSTLRVVDLHVNGTVFGTGNIVSDWDKQNKTINVNALITKNDTVKSVMVSGKVYPGRDKDNLDLKVQVNKLDLKALNPYLKGNVTFVRGDCSASFTVKGDQKDPQLEGIIDVRRTIAKIDYLGTTYNFVDKFVIKKDKILIDNLLLVDNNDDKNTALVSGDVTHNGFADWKYNINIKAKNFMCLNTGPSPDALYYGKAYVTGLISIKGDLEKTTISADVKTNPKTQFFIPLSSTNSASSKDFIVFVDHNPKKVAVKKRVSTGIVLNLDLEVTPDAEVQIIFDKQVGDIIKGKGYGNLKMNIDTKGDFKMYGEYIIEEGEYLFTLKNLLNKKFVVEKGGSINWSGDVYNARVDLTAIYGLKTSFLPIVAPYVTSDAEAEQYKKKLPVQARLSLTKNLLAPDFAFGLSTSTTDDKARTALSSIQTNPEELNKQIFALLILKQFLPPSQSGLTNSASGSDYGGGLGNNGYELLSSQLSSFLSQISDQFDINVDFVPATDGGPPQVVVGGAVRLGDRVSIDASVGNTRGSSTGTSGTNTGSTTTGSTAANTIVSDFNMEVKISNDGRWKGKVFNRSNQNNILNDDIQYTQGGGLSYRREFNTYKDLFTGKRKTVQPPPPTAPADSTKVVTPESAPLIIDTNPLSKP